MDAALRPFFTFEDIKMQYPNARRQSAIDLPTPKNQPDNIYRDFFTYVARVSALAPASSQSVNITIDSVTLAGSGVPFTYSAVDSGPFFAETIGSAKTVTATITVTGVGSASFDHAFDRWGIFADKGQIGLVASNGDHPGPYTYTGTNLNVARYCSARKTEVGMVDLDIAYIQTNSDLPGEVFEDILEWDHPLFDGLVVSYDPATTTVTYEHTNPETAEVLSTTSTYNSPHATLTWSATYEGEEGPYTVTTTYHFFPRFKASVDTSLYQNFDSLGTPIDPYETRRADIDSFVTSGALPGGLEEVLYTLSIPGHSTYRYYRSAVVRNSGVSQTTAVCGCATQLRTWSNSFPAALLDAEEIAPASLLVDLTSADFWEASLAPDLLCRWERGADTTHHFVRP